MWALRCKGLAIFGVRAREIFLEALLLAVVFGAHGQTSAGNALMFHGGAYVSISNSAALNLYPLTIMGWVDNQDFGGGMG